MGIVVNLKVGDKEVRSTEITYDDLVILYQQYIKEYGEVPIFSKCDSKHNMPQGRIINRILEENQITYNDFLLQFGKVSHVRTENKNYDLYVKRYKEVSDKLGHYLTQAELMNNSYGLPGYLWLVKYCPDKKVKTFIDFVKWCGYEVHYNLDKEYVSKKLIELEKKLGRHITKEDITLDNVGFSEIVIVRIWGSMNNMKKDLELMKSISVKPISIEECKERLQIRLGNIYKKTGRKFVSWTDIESDKYPDEPLTHKTYHKAFKRHHENLNAYIKSLGYKMCKNNIGNTYTFDDGELVKSTFEFDFTTYLRNQNIPYKRNVMYKTFANTTRKIDCDYVIQVENQPLYIEIAGVIYNSLDDDWRYREYHSKRENNYRDNMLEKENLLHSSNANYLFLFPWDMVSGKYIDILNNKIKEILEKAA